MSLRLHEVEGVNRTKTVRFYPFVLTSEERDEEAYYGYCNDYQPHAVKRMFDYKNEMLYDMRWDDAGNLGQVSMGRPGEMFERGRFLFWTEDSRMHAAVDEKYFSYYVYDHSGGSCASREQSQACLSYAEMEQRRRSQRRLKLTGDSKQQDVCQRLRTPQNKLNEVSNADLMSTYTILDNPTLYPSAYMVLNNKGYTNVTEVESRASSLALPRCSNVTERKHYYAGTDLCASREQSQACLSYAETKQSVRSKRVAARIGSGGLSYDTTCVTANGEVAKRSDELFWSGVKLLNGRGNKPEDFKEMSLVDAKGKEVDWHKKIDLDKLAMSWQLEAKLDPGKIHSVIDDNAYPATPGNTRYENEPDVYFYHSDHLGGASWITDVNGKPVQHLQYLPFGEPYINQRPFGYSERFTFTGKERDEETGYGYFGARYMDYELLTSFLSVDRYASKYPSISPYVYCAWNPIVLTDPSGDTIINKYLQYKDSKGYGGELYARTQKLIDEFQTSHPEEFEYLNNLSFENEDGKCTPINIMIGISDEKGPKSPETGTRKQGLTAYEFDYEPVVYCDEKGKYTYKLNVVGIKDNKISITLFQRHHDIGTLANEFGDAIFVVLRPQTVYDERKLGYFRKATTNFSFHYEAFIKGERATCPNPFDLDEY